MQTERKESYKPITIKYKPILRTCLYVYLRSFKEGMCIFIAGRKSLIEEFPEGVSNSAPPRRSDLRNDTSFNVFSHSS